MGTEVSSHLLTPSTISCRCDSTFIFISNLATKNGKENLIISPACPGGQPPSLDCQKCLGMYQRTLELPTNQTTNQFLGCTPREPIPHFPHPRTNVFHNYSILCTPYSILSSYSQTNLGNSRTRYNTNLRGPGPTFWWLFSPCIPSFVLPFSKYHILYETRERLD